MLDDYQPSSGFDLRERTHKPFESPLPDDHPDAALTKENELDTPKMKRQHGRLLGMYQRELDRQQENRQDMATDEDFYDSIQWDENDANTLRDRGQVPIVYNVIANAVNWVIGSEKRGRIDFKVLPRRKSDGKPAERKTQLMKYLSDVNRTPFHRSRAFEDSTKVGVGWLEDGASDGDDGEPVYSRYESWRNMLWDSASTELDLKDARYVFRTKWVDLDFAEAMFPERKSLIRLSSQDSVRYGASDIENGDDPMDSAEQSMDLLGTNGTNHLYSRDRVRMIEAWFRLPVMTKRIRGGDLNGDVWDASNPFHQEQLQAGRIAVIEKVMARMHCAIMTTGGLCYFGTTPYRHNEFPFTPIWGYRRGRDGMPYGMIRNLRDIQADINKRASKALAIMSTNKVVLEEGSVDDVDEFAEEVARPDAVLVYKKGAQKPEINADRELAAGHLQLMQQSIAMIQQTSGVTDELLGRRTNASSGVAIQARQDQGSLATAKFFDNLRFANQVQGEKQLSLVEQYFTEEKAFRITNMRGTPEYIVVNDGLPENDIVRSKADFVISEQEWRASVRQAQVAELLDVMQKLAPVAPQAMLAMLDLVVESMDIPSREEIVSRLRKITGMRDPDAEEPTAEELAAAQAQQKQQQMQEAMFQAELENKQADAAKKAADAQRIGAQTRQVVAQTAQTNVQAQSGAIDTALKAVGMPAAVPVADIILKESGFRSRTEDESDQAQAARAAQQEAEAAQQEQMQAEQQAQQQQQMADQQTAAAQQQAGLGAPPSMNQ